MPSAVSSASLQSNVSTLDPDLAGRPVALISTNAGSKSLAGTAQQPGKDSVLDNKPCTRLGSSGQCTVPLQEVLNKYCARKPRRLEKDLKKHPGLNRFLELQGSKLLLKHEKMTTAQFNDLLSGLKKAGHKSGPHLRGHLDEAWKTGLQQTTAGAPESTSPMRQEVTRSLNQPPQPNSPTPNEANDCAPTRLISLSPNATTEKATNEHDLDDLNPFANDPDIEETEDLNPFANDRGIEDATAPSSNPFDIPDEAQETFPSATQLDMKPASPVIFLQLLNAYVKTKDGSSFGGAVKEHVEKIRIDIHKNPVISQYLRLVGEVGNESVEWLDPSISQEEMQKVLDAFETRHDIKGSFYKVITQFDLTKSGFRLINEHTHNNIIKSAARPAMHRPGKHSVVDMKHTSMIEALKHFSSPERHEQALPDGILDPLITHYGRVDQERDWLQETLDNLKSGIPLSLNDSGIIDAIKRLFHQVNTESRIERFDKGVENADLKFRKKMLEMLSRVQKQHPPELVAARTQEKLKLHLAEAYKNYASKIKGVNTYPLSLSDAAIQQIKDTARHNFQAVLQDIVTAHEKGFVDHLKNAVTLFSIADFFKGKSLDKSVENAIKINDDLSTLHAVAEDHHQRNMDEVKGTFNNPDVLSRPDKKFQELQSGLMHAIRDKILSNYKGVLGLYDPVVQNLNKARSDDFNGVLKSVQTLEGLSKTLAEDVRRIRSHPHAPSLKLDKIALHEAVQETTKPLLSKIRQRLPEVQNIRQTLKSALIRAFKPTPGRMLFSIPLVGGLALALSTLPTAVAVPLGIVSAVMLPLALLGWVGWNIHKRFDQRSEITHLIAETEKSLKTIETDNS